jgi:N-methylhydantoinase A
MTDPKIRLGADIGGTFTDVVLEVGAARVSTKVLTTYAAPEDAIVTGLHQVCAKAGITPDRIGQIIHGTTLATNALIERRGAHTALITTDGFRDVIEMRSESRFEQYDLNLTLPLPLLPRDQRFTVRERMDADGGVLIALDRAGVVALCHQLRHLAFTSIAVGLLHAYANPAHERMIREVLAQELPGVMVSLSSDVSPQMREYERFSTTIANAYIQPLIASYLHRLSDRLAAEGAACPVFLMHSGGGIMDITTAADFPVRLVESGPAGGAVFAADIAAQHGLDKVLSFDMGGTTAKICLIRDQSPKTARVFEVARSYRFKKGSGMPISIPVIDMVEIGAGGGSLAHVDALSRITVGPHSAGSEPGPACYGRGGTQPAVTDADLLLGKLDAAGFAGGTIPLHTQAAQESIAAQIGIPLQMDVTEAAWGVAEVVDENMANAARVHAVENGEDLAGYTMIAFGGAAPLHAARLCEKLGITRCLIPPGAGVGSAIGFLRAPFSFEATRSVLIPLDAFDTGAVRDLFAQMRFEATAFVRSCDADAPISCDYKVFMRYRGQGWDIPVPLSAELAESADPAIILARFEAEYTALFGRTVQGMLPEITVWSVNARTPVVAAVPVKEASAAASPAPTGSRPILDAATGQFGTAAIYARNALPPGTTLPGPAAITEDETTIIVPPSRNARVLPDGCIALEAKS